MTAAKTKASDRPVGRRAGPRVLLATADPVFAVLCQRALEGAEVPSVVVATSPPELLQVARQSAHDVLVLDADQQDIAALKTLAGKAMLLSDAPIVLVSASLAPGSSGLGALLGSISAHFVQKPQGPSSLSLADADGPPFVAALQAAFAAHEESDLGAKKLDAGSDVAQRPAAERAENV
jgi:chemotaxis response regulator CheB